MARTCRVRLYLAVVFCMLTTHSFADWVSSGGPPGAVVRALTVFDGSVYAGTYGGLFRSSDGGQNWENIESTIPSFSSILAFTQFGGKLFVGDIGYGVYHFDAQTGWSQPGSGFPSFAWVYGITAVRNTIIAGSIESGVYHSRDTGKTWVSGNTGLTDLRVNRVAANRNFLFAGTITNGIFRSSDSVISWEPVNTGLSELSIYALYVHGDSIFVGTQRFVYVSTDNGEHWQQVGRSLDGMYVQAITVFDGIIFAGTVISLYRLRPGTVDWTRADNGTVENAGITALLTNNDTLYAGANNGVYRSIDTGAHWTFMSGIAGANVRGLAVASDSLFAGLYAGGVFATGGNGLPWKSVSSNLYWTYVTDIAYTNGLLYAGHPGGGIISVSSTNGGTWSWELDPIYSNGNSPKFAVGDGFIVAYDEVKGVVIKKSAQSPWTLANTGLIDLRIRSLCVCDNVVFAATAGNGIFVSADTCASWGKIESGISDTTITCVSAAGNGVVYAGTRYAGIYVSNDTGKTWAALPEDFSQITFRDIFVRQNLVFAVGNNGTIFISKNSGITWRQINEGLSRKIVTDIEILNDVVYAATNCGVWARPLSECIDEVGVVAQHQTQTPRAILRYTKGTFFVSSAVGNAMAADIRIFNINGQLAAPAIKLLLHPASQSARVPSTPLPKGRYVAVLRTGNTVAARITFVETGSVRR